MLIVCIKKQPLSCFSSNNFAYDRACWQGIADELQAAALADDSDTNLINLVERFQLSDELVAKRQLLVC